MQESLVLPQTVGQLRDVVGGVVFDKIIKTAQATNKVADTGRVQTADVAYTYGRVIVELCDHLAVIGLLLCQLYVGSRPDTDEYYWCVAPLVGHQRLDLPLCIGMGGHTEALRELLEKLDQLELHPAVRSQLVTFYEQCLATTAELQDLPPPSMTKERFLKML